MITKFEPKCADWIARQIVYLFYMNFDMNNLKYKKSILDRKGVKTVKRC